MKQVFKFLILLWIIFAFFNVFYNTRKTIQEVREWTPLSDSQKRHKLFGDLYDFFTLIKNHTGTKAHVLIFSTDDRTRFLSIYYLYPRIIESTNDNKKFIELARSKKFTYISSFDNPIRTKNYIQIVSFSSKTSSNFGSIYKLK